MTPHLVRSAWRDATTAWQQRTPAQTIVIRGALAFLASGVFHAGVWLVAGAPPLTGPVSWRKPIVFGLSTGVLSLSLAWVLGLLPQQRWLLRQARLYTWLLVGELALIDLQQWRGVGSHFNNATPLDGAIFTTMGALIMIVAVLIVFWTRALFRPLPVERGALLGARAGMVFLNLGNAMGMFIAAWGAAQLAAGLAPNIFGAAGQLKVPHAVALHALQLLPAIAWLAGSGASQLRSVRLATAGYASLFAFTLLQTFAGRAPSDIGAAAALFLVAAALLLGWATARALMSRPHDRCGMLPEWDTARSR